MNLNTEKLDSEFNSLNIDDQFETRDSRKAQDHQNDLEIRAQNDQFSRYSGIILNNAGDINQDSLRMRAKNTKSLLSSSLAVQNGDKINGIQNTTVSNQKEFNAKYEFANISEEDIDNDMLSDHPEPVLLASSVGKEIDGRLVPSSSNISLLSLSNQFQGNPIELSDSISSMGNFQGNAARSLNSGILPTSVGTNNVSQSLHSANSYSNISSRTSMTLLNQKRYQPYHKFSSPSPGQLSNQQQENYSSIPISQGIPIQSKYPMKVPDSPNLDPTSLGGSPSRFFLSNQTPPRSIPNSLEKNIRSLAYQQASQQPMGSQSYGLNTSRNFSQNGNQDSNYFPPTTYRNYKLDGSSSPILNPVRTPSEDPPMTPLYLSSSKFPLVDTTINGQEIAFDLSATRSHITAEENSDNLIIKDDLENSK